MGLIMVRMDLFMCSRDANAHCVLIRNESFVVTSNDGMFIHSIGVYLQRALMRLHSQVINWLSRISTA